MTSENLTKVPKIRITLEMDSNKVYSVDNLNVLRQNIFDLIRRIELDILHDRLSAHSGAKFNDALRKVLENAYKIELSAAKQLIDSMKIEII